MLPLVDGDDLGVVFFLRAGFLAFVPAPVALVTVFALLLVPLDFLVIVVAFVVVAVEVAAAVVVVAVEVAAAAVEVPGAAAAGGAGAGAMVIFEPQTARQRIDSKSWCVQDEVVDRK